MSEESIPTDHTTDGRTPEVGLNIFSDTLDADDPGALDPAAAQDPASPGADGLDQLSGSGPDEYPGAAENNPDNWSDDPLIAEDAAAAEGYRSEQYLEDQTDEARYETGEEQIPPDEPTIGEASADVDFGETPTGDEADGSDDEANFGGSPLGRFGAEEPDPEDLDG
ncbi:hypothetical protein [Paenarthrobacter sp. PH39-S1]|uniref:hypothetical protein n=1 Tax=Micrococcaceae TaxID=1268 RepID=UPI0024BA01B5|nr:hypothetical protein [Paenarthrobacter sp. PH39-S1]MDJ0355369.1 hypothetical protein [Paenarthrobacter sp. PH39-S1]